MGDDYETIKKNKPISDLNKKGIKAMNNKDNL